MIVPTRDTTRYSWLLKLHLKMGFPLFLTGMTGVGKSIISGYTLRSLRNNQIISLSFSSQTSAKETQRKIEDKLEKKKRNLLSGNKN
jgi:dynein heavy chain